ncbi:MAG: MFS transporter [Promethearchaeota archaeon]
MSNLTLESNSDENYKVSYKKSYIYYAAAIFGITNLLDIFSSNAGPLVKSYVIQEFFLSKGIPQALAYSKFGLLSSLGMPLMILSFSLRIVADKYGRKPALIINVIGMTIGAALILYSNDFTTFMIGTFFGSFFLTADIQLLMITEESPKDKRSQFLAFARIIGLIGAMGVPLMRGVFLKGDNPNWRGIYYLPLIIGILTSLLVIFTLKESSVYLTMKNKQNAIKLSEKEQSEKKEKPKGLFKQALKLKGFKIIFLTSFVGVLGILGGMAERDFMEPFLSGQFTVEEVNMVYYLRYGISIILGLIIGIIRDKMGRKFGLILTLSIQCIFLGLFFLFINLRMIILAGICYGLFIYAIFMNPVTAGLITNELTPTKIRGTMGLIIGLMNFVFTFIWIIIQSILVGMGVSFAWLIAIATIPSSIIGIILTIWKVPETKGTDLTTLDSKLSN